MWEAGPDASMNRAVGCQVGTSGASLHTPTKRVRCVASLRRSGWRSPATRSWVQAQQPALTLPPIARQDDRGVGENMSRGPDPTT